MNKNTKYLEFLKLKSVIDPNTGLTTIPALNPMLYSLMEYHHPLFMKDCCKHETS